MGFKARSTLLAWSVLALIASAGPVRATSPASTANTPDGVMDSLGGEPAEALAFEPVAVPEPSAETIRYHREGRRLWVIGQIGGLAVPALLLATGLSIAIRGVSTRAAARLISNPPGVSVSSARAPARWMLAVAGYGVAYLVLVAVVALPLSYYAGFLRPHAYGLSNQSLDRWFRLWATDLGVSLVLTIPALWVVYGLIRLSPRWWWLGVGLLTVPVALGTALVKPVLIDPLYNDFGPMADRDLEARILALAERAGVDGSRVYEVDKSRDTKAVNAYVTGFLGTKRIVLWDTLTAKLDDDQVLVVMAHELGHYVLGHVVKGLLVSSALTLLGLYLLHRVSRWILCRFGGRLGIERLADVASLPLLLGLARLISLAIIPFGYGYSRHIEHQADVFALELTRDSRAAATAFVALQAENLSHPRPGWLDIVLRSTHPSLGDRIDHCNRYRPWEEGLSLRYAHLFRVPAPETNTASGSAPDDSGDPRSSGS